ncbi:MAG TPA: glycosyltransferase [Ferruginibacter sp.]|nr:glycosyltransferase [Ferruginibacter sp.]HMP19439.1 glycosyltransferase [Ferruginibacter sp.]
MQHKILFISYDGMTDPLGQSQVIPYLQGLSKKGFRFHLLSCEKPEALKKNKTAVRQMLAGYNIQWHPVAYTKKPPVLSTLKDIVQLRRAAKTILEQQHIKLVHTRPGIPALIGLWMKKKYGVKFLHDIREFYADSRVEGGIWNKKNPLFNMAYRYFKKKEKEQLQQCDGIVCLTYAAEKIIKTQPGYTTAKPLKVIPCSVDLSFFNPSKINEAQKQVWKEKLQIQQSDFIVSYLGSVGGWYLTTEMMQFCKLVYKRMPNAKFLFITPHLHDVIAAEAAKHGIPASRLILQQASRNDIPVLLSLSQYSLFFIKPCFSKLSSSPTKHGELMAMGIPVVTNTGVGDVQAIIEKYNSGITINDFSNRSLEAAADQLCNNAVFNAVEIRRGAENFYALSKAIAQYYELYCQILSDVN